MSDSIQVTQLKASQTVQILIVEDERAIALNLKGCLETFGYQVSAIARNSTEAIARVETLSPDLVLMDIMLEDSEQDGIQVAQEIRERFGIPVVYLTAYANQGILERVKATAPFGYVIKPFREKELWMTIETAIQRHHLEQQLHQKQEWLDQILRNMGDGVIVIDTSARVQYINQAAASLTGWSADDALNRSLGEVFQAYQEPTRSPLLPELLQVLERDKMVQLGVDVVLITRTGQQIPIVDSAAPLHNDYQQVTGAVVVFRDIQDLRSAEDQRLLVERSRYLQEHLAQLERLNLLKDEFLSTVSHELRTPLSNIQLATEMLTRVLDELGVLSARVTEGSVPVERYLGILQEEVNQQLVLINNLLDMQRLNAETYPLQKSQILVQDWLPQILEGLEPQCKSQDRQWLMAIPPDLPPLYTDPHVLTRIISELVINACKYTPPHMTIFLNVAPEENPSPFPHIQISVCNSGIEIPIKEQEKVFEPFYRIPAGDRWAARGTGLGLAIVKRFTYLLGGTIQLESGDGQTCFHVRLPLEH
jgi:hypothetical protein